MMRMRVAVGLLSLLLLSLPALVFTQAPAAPQTLAECLKAAREYVTVKYRAARAAGQQANIQELNAQKAELARTYAARFPLDRVEGQDLPLLAQLLTEANDVTGARAAIARRLGQPGLSDEQRAEALIAGVGIGMVSPITEAGLAIAEGYAQQLDALKGGGFDQRLEAHVRLGGYYRGADVDDKIVLHMSAVLALAESLPVDKKKALGFRLVNAYTSLAEVYAGRGEHEKAVALLKRGQAELTGVPDAARFMPEVLKRYELVGQRGAAIEAPHWLNAEAGTTRLDPAGRVTVIQFTAHWCGPCRKSYPTMLRLHEKYGARGLQVLFSTQLYGFFEQRRPLSADEELAADRQYFLEHHKVPFKVSIEPQRPMGPDAASKPATRTWTEERYFVSGIPQIVILDKQGVVRRILIGWDPANEVGVTALIEELLR